MLHKCLIALILLLGPATGAGQDAEPRRWSHLPVDTNHLAVGYGGQNAEIYFSPVIGITDGSANINAWLARYSRAFDWSGRAARLDITLPYVSGTWRGTLLDGKRGTRSIRAGGDPWLRLSVNLYGAPALKGEDFFNFLANNPIRTTVGVSVAVSLPLGAYDPHELINVGRNRYTLRPQMGILHQRGPWALELTGSMFIFSDNSDFIDSTTLSQESVWAVQAHVSRNFGSKFWLGSGIAYAAGGRVQLDGDRTAYEVDNVLWNLVASYRINGHQSVSIAWQRGRTQVAAGSDFDSWLLSWAVSWGS